MATECTYTKRKQIQYLDIKVKDKADADIKKHFKEAIEFINKHKNSGGAVLIHCCAGKSRAPTICAAYLIKT